ncbi:hypothetical protein LguiA_025894 [Lonicera macranthoides]
MAVDPRQIVAGILTVTMFVMLGNMIKRDHFDSPPPPHTHVRLSSFSFSHLLLQLSISSLLFSCLLQFQC